MAYKLFIKLWLAVALWLWGSAEVTEMSDFGGIMCFSDVILNSDWQKYGFNCIIV